MRMLALWCFLFSSLTFADNAADHLKLMVIPTEPTLVPFGHVILRGVKYEAPYFLVNSLKLHWKGRGNLQLARLRLDSDDEYALTCVFDSDRIHGLFPQLPVSETGEIVIGEGLAAVESLPFVCNRFRLPQKSEFDILAHLGTLVFVSDTNGHLTGDVFMGTTTFHVK